MPAAISDALKLQYRAVSFAYRRSPAPALQEIDFAVGENQLVGVVGATGAGKSTLVRCASGIVPKFFRGPFTGQVRVCGEPIADRRVADLAGAVGTVFQDFESQLFSTNARLECAFGMENLGLERAVMAERIERIAKLTGLSRLLDREPQSLSGGQKQRLALASVLCLQPQILLCDEPTTDLDPAGRKDLFAVLRRLREDGHAIVLVEHETERLLHADRIVVLRGGRVAARGTPREVLGDIGLCRENGIAAPQLFALCAGLSIPERPATIDAAVSILQQHGWHPAPGAVPAAAGFTHTDAPLIEVNDLHFAYTPGEPVLQGVSLEIRAGEFVAVLGSNGSGKTTLIKHLIGLLRPHTGQVRFRGEPVAKIGIAGMARKAGLVFQNPDHMLFAATVFDEIAFGLRNLGVPAAALGERTARALDAVGLAGRETADPFAMTKGDRQKLAVACVLAAEPEVLILDEPTTGLDVLEQHKMMDLLQRLNGAGHTILMITHAMEVAARYAQRAVLMAAGGILADGPTRELFADSALLARASLEAPVCTRIGLRFGLPALTVDELAAALRRRSP